MKRQWKKIRVKAIFWLVTEIALNLIGLDNLTDYAELLFEQELQIANRQPKIAIRVPFRGSNSDRNLLYHCTIDLWQKPISAVGALAFAPGFIGEIRVFIRKCFALFGFMQQI